MVPLPLGHKKTFAAHCESWQLTNIDAVATKLFTDLSFRMAVEDEVFSMIWRIDPLAVPWADRTSVDIRALRAFRSRG